MTNKSRDGVTHSHVPSTEKITILKLIIIPYLIFPTMMVAGPSQSSQLSVPNPYRPPYLIRSSHLRYESSQLDLIISPVGEGVGGGVVKIMSPIPSGRRKLHLSSFFAALLNFFALRMYRSHLGATYCIHQSGPESISPCFLRICHNGKSPVVYCGVSG